jgi:hypothetical protein
MKCTVSWTGASGTRSAMGFVAETGSGHVTQTSPTKVVKTLLRDRWNCCWPVQADARLMTWC